MAIPKQKNWLEAPNIQILWSKKHIFAPSGQLEPHRSMFSTRKRCFIGLLIWGYQKFYSIPRSFQGHPNWPYLARLNMPNMAKYVSLSAYLGASNMPNMAKYAKYASLSAYLGASNVVKWNTWRHSFIVYHINVVGSWTTSYLKQTPNINRSWYLLMMPLDILGSILIPTLLY